VKQKQETAEAELAKLRAQVAQIELEKQRGEMKAQLVDQGYDPEVVLKMIDNHPVIKKAQEIVTNAEAKQIELQRQEAIAQDKEKLRSAPYYKELETEIDAFLKSNSQIDANTAYDFLLGRTMRMGKIDELKKTASKAAAADLQDKLKRGTPITGDSEDDNNIDPAQLLDRTSIEMAKAFGHDPKSIARYVKDKIKRK
jgi:hypothetical protein